MLVNDSLQDDLSLESDITVMHPLYVILYEYGLDLLGDQVVKPLSGLRVASYYGCMLTRPRDEFDSPERPFGLDELMKTLSAQVVDYPMKAKCCGGALALSHTDVTARLTGDVLVSAKEAGADLVTLACPMCHTALDSYQARVERAVKQRLDIPVLYFTQLIGLALGLNHSVLGLDRHLVSPERVLSHLGI
jgi:heterodisulfide reductase subunit B